VVIQEAFRFTIGDAVNAILAPSEPRTRAPSAKTTSSWSRCKYELTGYRQRDREISEVQRIRMRLQRYLTWALLRSLDEF